MTTTAAEAFAALLGLAYRTKNAAGEQPYQSAVLTLLAALAEAGAGRLRIKDHTAARALQQAIAEGHGPALNLTHTLLVLMEPVFLTHPERMGKVRPEYPTQAHCTRLARLLQQPSGAKALEANFITELFYAAWATFYTAVLPTLEAREQNLSRLSHSIRALPPNSPQRTQMELQLWLEADKWTMALLSPQFLNRATHLCLETAKWLGRLPAEQRCTCWRVEKEGRKKADLQFVGVCILYCVRY